MTAAEIMDAVLPKAEPFDYEECLKDLEFFTPREKGECDERTED